MPMDARRHLQLILSSKRYFLAVVLLVAGLTSSGQARLYSYQSGSWNNPEVWTTDPGGTTLAGSRVPANNDILVILPSRIVTLDADVTTTGLNITIGESGTLNAGPFRFTSGLEALAGQGIYRLSSASFPATATNTFITHGGGTVEYCNPSAFDLPLQPEYNNLNINTSGITATQLNDLTINGNLNVMSGGFRINDGTNTRISLTVFGNVTVNAGCSLTVGSGNTTTTADPASDIRGGTGPLINYYSGQSHTVQIHGDLTNDGIVRFTNQAYPVFNQFPANGIASVFFRGAQDNRITANGITDFYNLIIDKGTDQTFTLSVNSAGYDRFRLFGANSAGDYSSGDVNNPNIRKSVWIRNGTFRLNGYVFIPSLVEGAASGGGDYYIPANGALVLGGPDVVVMGTIDDYSVVNLAYGVAGGSGAINGVTTESSDVPSSLSLYGRLQVNAGYLYTGEIGRIIYFGTSAAQFIINGGIIDTKQFQSVTGGGKTAFWQTAGQLVLRGRFKRDLLYSSIDNLIQSIGNAARLNTARATNGAGLPLGTDPSVGTFNIDQDANIFHMEGGEIEIYDVTGNSGTTRALEINADPANVSVSGGKVRIIMTHGTVLADAPYGIASKAPLFNLEITRQSSDQSAVMLDVPAKAGVTAVASPPLKVLNNFLLSNTSGSNNAILNSNGYNVQAGGNFNIGPNAVYNPGNNRTVLNGSGSQSVTNSGTIIAGLHRFVIDKTSGTATLGSDIIVRDSLVINGGTLSDGGYLLQVAGHVFNSGTHTGPGILRLNGTSLQNISSSPGATSQIGNLELGNTTGAVGATGVALLSPVQVNSLTLSAERVFFIGSHMLTVEAAGISATSYGVTRMIRTSGFSSDGGVKRYITSAYNNQIVLFPVGCQGGPRNAAVAWFPGRIHLGNVTTPGYFTVVPVAGFHPSCDAGKQNSALDFYWKTRIAGLVTSGTRHIEFDYSTNIPNSYNDPYYLLEGSSVWGTGSGNNNSPTLILPVAIGITGGDFTAGKNSPFRNPATYFSRGSGAWNQTATWSLTGHTGTAASSLPSDFDRVIIGGVSGARNDSVTVTANGIRAAIITINGTYTANSRMPVLNIQSTTGHIVDIIRGAGKFSTSTATVPATPTDFGSFLMNDTAVFHYYGEAYSLPASISTYPNLLITGAVKTLNSNNITVRKDLIIADEAEESLLSLNGSSGDLTIIGSIRFKNGGILRIPATTVARNLNIYGDIDFTYGNSAGVNSIETAGNNNIVHRLNFYGKNIISGASNLNFNPVSTNKIDLYFRNSGRVMITAGTGSFSLNRLFISKESVSDTVFFRNNFSLNSTLNNQAQKSLVLQAGILVLSDPANGVPSAINLNISSGGTNRFQVNQSSGLILRNGSAVNITGDATGSGIYLDGLLRAEDASAINLADGSAANTGFIEYSGSGKARIELSGTSRLYVSQVRRSLLLTTGLLDYSQSESSSAIIYGLGADATRAKFEITGTGSSLNMSGNSTISLIRGGGSLFGDLFLRPETSQVTGGTITFGDGIAGQVYRIDADVPLNNLILNAPSGINELRLSINPLVLKGSLSLNDEGSTLAAGGINLAIGGNFTCNGTYISGQNTTFFNGTSQAITGNNDPLFWNLASEPSSFLSIGRDITVNNDLRISTGIFSTASFSTIVKGNVVNDGSYSNDPSPAAGRLLLSGSARQNLSGTGAFGRIELNNGAGAHLLSNISLADELLMVGGSLDINQYSLVLGVNSYITGGPFGAERMIKSDGALSNGGILKSFAGGYTGTFIYPSGVGSKYTPATITIVSASAGSISINPVNERHPATFDPWNVLRYYWDISATIGSFEGSLALNYNQADVTGDESQYVAARLIIPPGTGWSKAASGSTTDNVDESAHAISFSYPSGTANLGGQYTAGYSSDLPNTIPVYSSNVVSGNWDEPASWTPAAPAGGPNGFSVIINPGHTIHTNGNKRFSFTTAIEGTLDAGTTYGHNLGTVRGTGRILMLQPNLPAGDFSSFLSCEGGTLEYGGTNDYTIVADRIDTVRNLVFSGSGIRRLPDKDLVICNQLEINGPLLDNYFSRKLTILGSFDLVSGTFSSGTGAGATIVFRGTAIQHLSGFSGVSSLNNLEINNSAGLVLSSAIDMKGNLVLTRGTITTSTANILSMISQSSIATQGSASSYINGPLIKNQLGGTDFIFPVGNARYGRLGILNPQSGTWEAEYINSVYTDLSVTGTLVRAASGEYWRIKSPANGKTARVELRWDNLSEITPATTAGGINDIRVAEYNGADWTEKSSVSTGDATFGTVTTLNPIPIGSTIHPMYYTLGSVSQVKPSIILGIPEPVCQCTSPAYLPYISVNGNPTQYSIDFDNAANTEGFADVPWSALPASPIAITVPAGADPGIYSGVIRVRVPSPENTGNLVSFSLIVIPDFSWTGSVNASWNVAGNWACSILPGMMTSVRIPDVPNKPVLSSGSSGSVKDLTINAGASLTVSGNTLSIAGTITNNGTFNAAAGEIVLTGTSAQSLGNGLFENNTIMDLTVNNPEGVSMQGPLSITGILYLQNGNLASSGNLTLASTATGTALIDGNSTGQVTGPVTMQRWLSSAYGYKYFSSPFSNATVGEFSDEINLASSFPLFYAYDENRWFDIYPLHPFYAYTNPASVLAPMAGYALNFGSSGNPLTVDVTGVVNNGPYSVSLQNHNHPIAIGRNLVGNPYPSPIDWSAPQGWIKDNIDNALYYFRSSTTDEWGGVYSSWINGVGSDATTTDIIPSMQGFLVHVSDGAYPVTATLSMDNRVRVNNMSQPFQARGASLEKSVLRLTASFTDRDEPDPFVLYTDEKSTPVFDSQLDALKYFNTDINVPNLYSFEGARLLSIRSMPAGEKPSEIPLGLKSERNGEIVFRIGDVTGDFSFIPVFLKDALTGSSNDLLKGEYRVMLNAGEYNDRFSLGFGDMATGINGTENDRPSLKVYSFRGKVMVDIVCGPRGGTFVIGNLTGQVLFNKKLFSGGRYEFSPGVKTGIYIITFVSGNTRISERLFIQGE
jgi:hypothetical protein